jgi:hypothetical protein
MQSDAGETERLPNRAWSHRRQTCQRENKISGDSVTGSMNGASAAVQPWNPGNDLGNRIVRDRFVRNFVRESAPQR